jgi:hypothetical protein
VRTALLVVTVLALAAAPAFGENGYDAKLVAQSPNLTLESGEVGDSYFDAQNVGPWAAGRSRPVAVRIR